MNEAVHLSFGQLPWGEMALVATAIGLAALYLIFGLDDLLIDLVSLFRRLRPQRLPEAELRQMHAAPQKRIAILVPAWKESAVIRRMVTGNVHRIAYRNYHFFIGVYPNDLATVRRKVERSHERNRHVHAVVNSRPGPSSKGQMLNQVIEHILRYEAARNIRFDLFLMQDAEDVIHADALTLVNRLADDYDFIQIPVFSQAVERRRLVASTYMDEFAESHAKDLLVRESLGAAIPSAGVGTALTRELVLTLREKQGAVFEEDSLTEDYQLGVRAHALGFRPHFACHYVRREGRPDDYIATREFFPKRFTRSLRQKTRWTTGIVFQGWRQLGWPGNLANRYFLYRDRRGIVGNLVAFLGYPVVGLMTLSPSAWLLDSPVAHWLFWANLTLVVNRLAQRMRCVRHIYGARAALTVFASWPIATTINAFSSWMAFRNDWKCRAYKTQVAWAKTDHELPDDFGMQRKRLVVAR